MSQNDDIGSIQQWVGEYWNGYYRYMLINHPEIFSKFIPHNIFPPQRIGGGIGISQGKT